MGLTIASYHILKEIYDFDNPPSIGDVADALDVSNPYASKEISKLEDKGWIKKESHQNGGSRLSIYVTEAGKDAILEGTESPEEVKPVNSERTSPEGYSESKYFIHNFRASTSLRNRDILDESWVERSLEYEEIEYKYISEFGHHHLITDKWLFRVTQENVTVRVREEIQGSDVRSLKDQMMDKVRDGIEFLEDRTPLKLDSKINSLRVESQHIGRIGHHLAMYLENHYDGDPTEFRVREDDGELLMWIDRSDGRLELEAGNGGRPSGKRETAEDDMAFLEEWVYRLRSNKDQARDLFSLRPEVDDNSEKLDQLDQAIRLLLSRELKQDREDVSGSSYDNPVQEKFMEYWRDPEYNRPFFHTSSGGLMAFRSDGSGCKKILSGDEVERLS